MINILMVQFESSFYQCPLNQLTNYQPMLQTVLQCELCEKKSDLSNALNARMSLTKCCQVFLCAQCYQNSAKHQCSVKSSVSLFLDPKMPTVAAWCERCNQNQAQVICKNCQQSLFCRVCSDFLHKSSKYAFHKLIEIEERQHLGATEAVVNSMGGLLSLKGKYKRGISKELFRPNESCIKKSVSPVFKSPKKCFKNTTQPHVVAQQNAWNCGQTKQKLIIQETQLINRKNLLDKHWDKVKSQSEQRINELMGILTKKIQSIRQQMAVKQRQERDLVESELLKNRQALISCSNMANVESSGDWVALSQNKSISDVMKAKRQTIASAIQVLMTEANHFAKGTYISSYELNKDFLQSLKEMVNTISLSQCLKNKADRDCVQTTKTEKMLRRVGSSSGFSYGKTAARKQSQKVSVIISKPNALDELYEKSTHSFEVDDQDLSLTSLDQFLVTTPVKSRDETREGSTFKDDKFLSTCHSPKDSQKTTSSVSSSRNLLKVRSSANSINMKLSHNFDSQKSTFLADQKKRAKDRNLMKKSHTKLTVYGSQIQNAEQTPKIK